MTVRARACGCAPVAPFWLKAPQSRPVAAALSRRESLASVTWLGAPRGWAPPAAALGACCKRAVRVTENSADSDYTQLARHFTSHHGGLPVYRPWCSYNMILVLVACHAWAAGRDS